MRRIRHPHNFIGALMIQAGGDEIPFVVHNLDPTIFRIVDQPQGVLNLEFR